MAALATPALASAAPAEPPPRIAPTVASAGGPTGAAALGEAIVRFVRGTSPAERLAVRRSAGVALGRALELSQAQVVEVEGSVGTAVRRLEREPNVAFAQPNYVYRTLTADPLYEDLWGLPEIDAPTGWSATRGGGQVIAVLDTGVDLAHPDLAPRLWSNPSPDPLADDVHGYDFVAGDGSPDDFHYHGTHVAGTAAATADNGIGIAGVAPEARIMAVRVLDGDGVGYSDQIADGVGYAAAHGADVINMSLGGPAGDEDALLAQAVADAGIEHDVVVVAAAGNGNDSNDLEPQSPCQAPDKSQPPNLICVAATAPSGQLAGFSNWGAESVHLAAPGEGIWSARPPYARVYPATGGPDGFESGVAFGNDWGRFVGTTAWGRDNVFQQEGVFSAADTPGADYANGATASLVAATDTSLAGRRGCRMQFSYRLRLADDGDTLMAGLWIGDRLDLATLDTTDSGFEGTSLAFEQADGKPAVAPVFWLRADGNGVDEGANVDEVELLCRSNAYGSNSYLDLNGTSMAAPHVSGVAALVRAAVPGTTAAQTVAALVAGAKPLVPTPGKPTMTNGIVNAPGALAAAGWVPSPPAPPPPGASSADPPAAAAASRLRRPNLSASPARLRVNRTRRIVYRFRARPGLRGVTVLRTRVKAATARGGLRRLHHFTIARKRFVVPASGRVVARIRLTPRQLRILRLNRRLRLLVDVTVRSGDGRSAGATRRLLLLPPQPRS